MAVSIVGGDKLWGSKSLEVVTFDLDGTLIDSAADIAAATNYALKQQRLPERSLGEVRSFIGDGSRKLLERASGLSREDPVVDALLGAFLEFYAEHPVEHTLLLGGALEVLRALRGRFRLALCTNKPSELTLPVLEQLAIAPYFEAVVAAGDVPQTKPHPAPLRAIAERLAVACERIVMVGDGPQDIGCARAAGCRSIALNNGLYASAESLALAGPDVNLALRDIPAFLSGCEANSIG